MNSPVVERFWPATREWFTGTFGAPTPAQEGAWEAISEGQHTLVVAPTGSGKTLSAFLWGLDQVMHAGDDAQPDRARTGVLGQRIGQGVDVGAAHAGGRLDLLQGGAHAHPQLAIAGVAVELPAGARGPRSEVEDRLVRRGGTICDIDVIDVVRGPRVLVRRGERVQDEHGVRLEVRAGSGQVGEGAVGPEPVVAVVVAHLERAGGEHQTLAGEEPAEGLTAGGRPRSRLAAGGQAFGTRPPPRADEVTEGLVLGLAGPVGASRRQGLGSFLRGVGGLVGRAVVCGRSRCHRGIIPLLSPYRR